MKISCNILKKHIENSNDIDWQKIWEIFTIRTAEVEGIEIKGNDIQGVVVAEIIECQPHPKKEKYHILKVNTGKEVVDILCGAPNVRQGLKVPLVKVGGKIAGFEIAEKEIAGVLSQGMLCSENELGISDNHEGIFELPNDYEIGKDIKEYLPEIEDIIVEIDNKSLTNRPDLWGHYGIAREVAAITNHSLKDLDQFDIPKDKHDLDIKVKSELCLRYTGLKISNIQKKKTPNDIKIALYYTGMRSISLIVDLTNYVMIVLGQPMHAFDARKVKSIEVDCANNGDKFITLDGVERILTPENLMIKNNEEYFAIAGVMGGLHSEILEDTNSIILESATFDATSIRKTATQLGLRTEASARYEKSLDPNTTLLATRYFVKLLSDNDTGITFESNLTDVYLCPQLELSIKLTKDKVNKYMGQEVDPELVKKILESLSFKVKINKDNYTVTVPTYRATKDVTLEVDLIEELARMVGYENFAIVPLKLDLTFKQYESIFEQEYEAKRLLATKFGLNEVHSYLWYKTSFLNSLDIHRKNTILVNKTEDNIIRCELAIHLLEMAQNNLKYLPKVGIFEIGTTIVDNSNKKELGILLCDDDKKAEELYYQAKRIIQTLFKTAKNLKVDYQKAKASDLFEEGYSYAINCNNKNIGEINIVKSRIAKAVNRKKVFVIIKIDFDEFVNLEKQTNLYQTISKYPQVSLDYTIIAGKENKYSNIESVIKEFSSPIIKSFDLTDVYEDDYEKKYTIRYSIGSDEKTLAQEELMDFKEKFINHIKSNGFGIAE